MQICNLPTVSVVTTAGGTEILSSAAATAAIPAGLMILAITPSVDIVLVDNGGLQTNWANIPGATAGTVANSPFICAANATTFVRHNSGSVRAISTSGAATVKVGLGMSP